MGKSRARERRRPGRERRAVAPRDEAARRDRGGRDRDGRRGEARWRGGGRIGGVSKTVKTLDQELQRGAELGG